jgi:hypothetical protein
LFSTWTFRVDDRVKPTAVRFSENGCTTWITKQLLIVMPGLDPGIHGVPKARLPDFGAGGTACMTGSSPVMTIMSCIRVGAQHLVAVLKSKPDSRGSSPVMTIIGNILDS